MAMTKRMDDCLSTFEPAGTKRRQMMIDEQVQAGHGRRRLMLLYFYVLYSHQTHSYPHPPQSPTTEWVGGTTQLLHTTPHHTCTQRNTAYTGDAVCI